MDRWIRVPLLCIALASSACFPTQTAQPTGLLVVPPTRSLDGKSSRVDLLVRAFLPSGSRSQSGFAYYSYLLFADRGESTRAARHAAAVAYIRLLDNVEEAPRAIPTQRLGVLYAPISSLQAGERCAMTKDPKVLLDEYDYTGARMMWNALSHAGARLPRVALVGHPQPLDGTQGPFVDKDVFVVDLSVSGQEVTERRLLTFRDSLETGDGEMLEHGMPAVLVKAREFFRLIGLTLKDLKEVAAGSDT
jgi:hypothetical protein